MKKFLLSVMILFLAIGTCFFINYKNNEKAISENRMNNSAFLGFTEPYINPYNNGNVLYNNGNYEDAIKEYNKALKCNPPGIMNCKARINIALSMVMPIDIDSVNETNITDIISVLDDAINVLTEDGCAHIYDNGGHNDEAIQLKNDIENFKKKLQELQNDGDDGSQGGQDGNKPDDKENQASPDESKIDKLKDLMNKGTVERQNKTNEHNQIFDYETYRGKVW